MSIQVHDALARARGRGSTVVLVTVLEVAGDLDCPVGAKQVVEDGMVIAGGLGHDDLDAEGVRLAAAAIQEGRSVRGAFVPDVVRRVELVAEVHRPGPAVLVLGADPVSLAVADLAQALGRRTALVAPGGATAVGAGVEVKADDPARYLLHAPPGPEDAVVVGDPAGAWADEVTRVALASEAFYVGVADDDAARTLRRLTDAGVPRGHLQRLRIPAGLDLGGRSPEELGCGIVAEILAVERGREGGPRKLRWLA